MDTNIIRDLIAMMEAKNAAAAASGQNTIVIITMVIAALTPTLASIMAYFKAAAAKATGEKNTESLGEIHRAVNSKETATAKKIEDLEATVSKLIEQKATSAEQLRGIAVAAEVERAVSKERGSGGQSNQFPQSQPSATRHEEAAEKVEEAAEKVEGAAEKTESAVSALTDSEISKMIAELTKELTLRKR